MRRQINCIRAFILMLFSAFLLASPAHAAPKQWKISEVSGQVQVERDGSTRSGTRGMVLGLGDAVLTGETGRAVVVRGGEYVIVSPKSRLRIAKPKSESGFTQFIQYAGSVLFKIEKKETPHFRVETPYLAAVVKGTTFNVAVTPAGATVQVTEGRVEVSTLDGGAIDLIVPGRVARVDAGDRQLLKVLGQDEKAIRSPLPAAALPPLEPGEAASPSPTEDGQQITVTAAEPPATSENRNDDAGFSGRIGTPVISEPVSLAVVTSGLISNGPTMDRNTRTGGIDAPPAAAAPAQPVSSPATPANPGASGTDNPEAPGRNGGGNGNGNGNGGTNPAPDPAPQPANDGSNGGGNGNGGGSPGNGTGNDNRPPADPPRNNGGSNNGDDNGRHNGGGNGNSTGNSNGNSNGGGSDNGNGGGNSGGNGGGNGTGNDNRPPADPPANNGGGNGNDNNNSGPGANNRPPADPLGGNSGGSGNPGNGNGNANGNPGNDNGPPAGPPLDNGRGNGNGNGNDNRPPADPPANGGNGNGGGSGGTGGRPPR